jgi:hypothetical protein
MIVLDSQPKPFRFNQEDSARNCRVFIILALKINRSFFCILKKNVEGLYSIERIGVCDVSCMITRRFNE